MIKEILGFRSTLKIKSLVDEIWLREKNVLGSLSMRYKQEKISTNEGSMTELEKSRQPASRYT
jgi:hypothetical protein